MLPVAGMQVNGALGHPQTYRGYLDCVSRTLAVEGVRGLYRGWHVSLMKIMPGAAVQFLAYDFFKYAAHTLDPAATVQTFSRGVPT